MPCRPTDRFLQLDFVRKLNSNRFLSVVRMTACMSGGRRCSGGNGDCAWCREGDNGSQSSSICLAHAARTPHIQLKFRQTATEMYTLLRYGRTSAYLMSLRLILLPQWMLAGSLIEPQMAKHPETTNGKWNIWWVFAASCAPQCSARELQYSRQYRFIYKLCMRCTSSIKLE